MLKDTIFHYMASYYTTHQPDGVQLSAHYTCGEKLESVSKIEQVDNSSIQG